MPPRFPPRPHGIPSEKIYVDRTTNPPRVCTVATRTVVNGQTRCP